MIHIRILCLSVLACGVCICQGGSNVNLALKKPAFQSSTFVPTTRQYRHIGPFKAAFSVDGNRNTAMAKASCSHTKKEFQPWWAVDLGREMCVGGVTFVNRGDCCGERARDFVIGVTNKDPTKYSPKVGHYNQCGQWKGNVAKGATVQLQCDRDRRGRYVIVQLPRIDYLNFCELEVYGCGFQTTPAPTTAPTTTPTPTTTPSGGGSNVNLALNKPAYQSSTFVSTIYGALKAAFSVDGNRDSDMSRHSCSNTKKEFQPWWAVDLGREMCVGGVTFVNRGDCCGERARNFIIGVTNKNPTKYRPKVGYYDQCGQWKGNVPQGATVQLQCDEHRRGRYVIVHLPHADYLNFCELEVYGCGFQTKPAKTTAPTTTPTPTTPPGVCNCRGGSNVNLALKKPTFQSSTFVPTRGFRHIGPFKAAFSVDGNRNTAMGKGSCSATKNDDNTWWAVDIGREICVDRVVFVNRGDCCGDRANDFIIGVTNESPKSHPPTIGGYSQCGQWNGKVGLGATVELRCDKVARGRYIILQVPHKKTPLNFCELEVYGCA